MKKYNWAWFKEKCTNVKNSIAPKFKRFLGGVSIAILIYGVVLVLFYIIYQLSTVVEITVSDDKLSYLNSTSSLLLLIVTTTYVVFTYEILKTTEESTKQSEKVVQQTAKAQKISLLERKLELFYLPVESALKKIDMGKLRNERDFEYSLAAMFSSYLDEYNKIKQYRYLATDDLNTRFEGLYQKYNEQISGLQENYNDVASWYLGEGADRYALALPEEHKFFNYYAILRELVKKEIESTKDELAKLVNL